MAPFGAASLANLAGVKPVTLARANALAAWVTENGGDISVPEFGGLRTLTTQEQLAAYERDSVAAGGAPYAVGAPGHSKHETGDAFDVQLNTPLTGRSVTDSYKAMADYAYSLTLTPGYYFHSVPSDPYHFENADSDHTTYADGSTVPDASVDTTDSAGDDGLDVGGADIQTATTTLSAVEVMALLALAVVAILVLHHSRS